MKTAKIQNALVTFNCINCRLTVTEKMHPVHVQYIGIAGGCCEACCKIADDYFTSAEYAEFEEAEKYS